VLDTTVLISAFLRPVEGGASFELLRFAKERRSELFRSNDILDEVADTLTTHERMRRRYRYPDAAVVEYRRELARFAAIVGEIPEIRAVRDPDDDKILGCAIAAGADYLVTRDKDLLSLDRYREIAILPPERFLHLVRGGV
jgi:putative PIN family toxin of toxin-antitoxin system